MSGNTFGSIFKISTFGESHGEGIGVIIDGVPSGIKIDTALMTHKANLYLRKLKNEKERE